MDVQERQANLNTYILVTVVSFALLLQSYSFTRNNNTLNLLDQVIVLLTSTGFYELLIRGIYFLIENNDFFLGLYWGKLYIKGLWSYSYILNGKTYIGVWRIEQNLKGITVVGSGLHQDYSVRTIVKSVSPLIDSQGAYFVINDRTELESNSHIYSKTTLILNQPRRPLTTVKTMRAITEIYGGPSSGQVHTNVVFTKYPNANSEDDVIEELKKIYPGGII